MATQILVPMTLDQVSIRALELALTECSAAEITVLHVINPTVVPDGNGKIEERLTGAAERRAGRVIATATDLAAEHGVSIATECVHGQPRRAIIEYATSNDIDRIIMGSRCRTGLARLLAGSVAETVLRRTTIPVTIVSNAGSAPAPERESDAQDGT